MSTNAEKVWHIWILVIDDVYDQMQHPAPENSARPNVSCWDWWGEVQFYPLPLAPHICVKESGSIGSNNDLSPILRQVIILTNAALLSIGPLEPNFSEILIKMRT